MALRSIIFALGIVSAACSGAGLERQGIKTASRHDCSGGVVASDRDLLRLEECETVAGDLSVTNVSGLAPLASVRSVEGTLRINGTKRLYSFQGLEKLESVGSLEVQGNRGLISIGSLKHLAQAGRVLVSQNPRLSSTFGLPPALARGSAPVSVENNAGLTAEGIGRSYTHLADSRLAAH